MYYNSNHTKQFNYQNPYIGVKNTPPTTAINANYACINNDINRQNLQYTLTPKSIEK